MRFFYDPPHAVLYVVTSAYDFEQWRDYQVIPPCADLPSIGFLFLSDQGEDLNLKIILDHFFGGECGIFKYDGNLLHTEDPYVEIAGGYHHSLTLMRDFFIELFEATTDDDFDEDFATS